MEASRNLTVVVTNQTTQVTFYVDIILVISLAKERS